MQLLFGDVTRPRKMSGPGRSTKLMLTVVRKVRADAAAGSAWPATQRHAGGEYGEC